MAHLDTNPIETWGFDPITEPDPYRHDGITRNFWSIVIEGETYLIDPKSFDTYIEMDLNLDGDLDHPLAQGMVVQGEDGSMWLNTESLERAAEMLGDVAGLEALLLAKAGLLKIVKAALNAALKAATAVDEQEDAE